MSGDILFSRQAWRAWKSSNLTIVLLFVKIKRTGPLDAKGSVRLALSNSIIISHLLTTIIESAGRALNVLHESIRAVLAGPFLTVTQPFPL